MQFSQQSHPQSQPQSHPHPVTRAFPLNAWYAAAYDVEVGRQLLARTICNQALVLYRKADGTVAALEGACWHRLLPLSMGRLEGDELVCGYHGLEYNAEGRCTHMPSQETINPGACVRAYPVLQCHRFVWVWPGDPLLADPALVPGLHWNDDSAWAGDGQRIEVQHDYRLVIDNLMDLTHETFVHGSSIGNREVAEAPFVATRGERMATVPRWMEGITPPPFWAGQIAHARGQQGPVDRWQIIRFEARCTVVIDVAWRRLAVAPGPLMQTPTTPTTPVTQATPATAAPASTAWCSTRSRRRPTAAAATSGPLRATTAWVNSA